MEGSERGARCVADRTLVRDLCQGQVARLAGAGSSTESGTQKSSHGTGAMK